MTTKNTSLAGERTQTANSTKAPWHVQIVNGKTMIACHPFADDGSMQIAEVTRLKTTGKTQANARLISAAPELMEALKVFVDEYDTNPATWPDEMVTLLTVASAAIAKAEGRAE